MMKTYNRGRRGGFFAISKVPGQWQASTEYASYYTAPIRDHFENVGRFSIRAAKNVCFVDIETKRKEHSGCLRK